MEAKNLLTGTLKKVIKRQIIKIAVIIIGVLVLISAVVSLLYNSPLAIFLPALDEDEVTTLDVTGYDVIAEELETYYVEFNQEIYALKNEENAIVRYTDTHSNFWDVIKIYVCTMYDGVTDIYPCRMTDENKTHLKNVFNELNTYSCADETFYYEDGSSLGTYKVTDIMGDELYGTDDTYGECVIDGEKLPLVPVDSVISIGKKSFRVVDKRTLSGSSAIAVLAKKGAKATYKDKAYEISFVSTDEVEKISYERAVITVSVYDASHFMESYPLSDEQMEVYEMIESERESALSGDAEDSANVVSTPLNLSQQEFIEKVGVSAQEYYETYQILPSLVIAQACLESGYGTTKLGQECYNFFGMKWVQGCGCDYKEYTTQEQSTDGRYYMITARFRKYSSFEDGIEGYFKFINYDRYKNLVGETDYKTACRLIREDGWATDLNYTQKLIRIIDSYNLTAYDDGVLKGGDVDNEDTED